MTYSELELEVHVR